MKLLWYFTTPRKLRRNTLVALLIWTAVAFAHHEGVFEEIGRSIPDSSTWLPRQSQLLGELAVPLRAPRTL